MSHPDISVGYLPHVSEFTPRPPFEDLLGRTHPLQNRSVGFGAYLSEGNKNRLAVAAYDYEWDRNAYFPLTPLPGRLITSIALAAGVRYESAITRGVGLFEFNAAITAPHELRVELGAKALRYQVSQLRPARHRALIKVGDELAQEIYEKADFSTTGRSGKYKGQSYQEMALNY